MSMRTEAVFARLEECQARFNYERGLIYERQIISVKLRIRGSCTTRPQMAHKLKYIQTLALSRIYSLMEAF